MMSNSSIRLLEFSQDIEPLPLSRAPALQAVETRVKPKKRIFPSFNSIKQAFRDSRKDMSSIPWHKLRQPRRLLWHFMASIWIAFLFALLLFLSFGMVSENLSPCRADGDFSIVFDRKHGVLQYVNNWWALQGFFEINLGWGKLDFTAVKLIDVTWDLVVGRGGQSLMSVVTWKVFTEYLEVSIANQPATYTTVWLLRFHQDTSVLSSIRLFSQFCFRGLASKVAMWVMVMTLSFILAFPTIAGSMTGYTTFNDPYIALGNGIRIPFKDISPVAYIIRDGHRVTGFHDDYIIPWMNHSTLINSDYSSVLRWKFCYSDEEAEVDKSCELQLELSQYVQKYGFDASGTKTVDSRANETEFYGKTIEGSPLKISAYYLPSKFYWNSSKTSDNVMAKNPYNDRRKMMFVVDDQLYTPTQLVKSGVCQPNKDENHIQRYQWGFSFLQLYIVIILLLFWSLALGILWMSAHDMLELNHREAGSPSWKNLLDFTETMRMQLEQAGIDVDNVPDRQLENEIKTLLQGGSIASQYMPISSLRSCLLGKVWWIILGISATGLITLPHVDLYSTDSWEAFIGLFVMFSFMMCLSIAFEVGATLKQKFVILSLSLALHAPLFFYNPVSRDFVVAGTWFGLLLAMAFGSTKGSRLVLFLVPFLCNYIVNFILFFFY